MIAHRMQRLARSGASAALLLGAMFVASLGLWVAIPVGWFWIGGRVQGATGSLGAAIGVVLLGLIASVLLLLPVLGWLSRKHSESREARGLSASGVALEAVIVISAGLAVVVFCVWFFLIAGADPFPLGQSN